jgi:tubulin monoglycylase TTLL3/8
MKPRLKEIVNYS